MPPKKKANSTLANCWANPEPSTFASILPPSTETSSTSSDPESNPNKRKRVSVSYIWNHDTQVLRNDGSPGWECIHCRHVLSLVWSTSNQRYHLRKVHKITDPEHADDQQTTLDTHILRLFRVDVVRKLLLEYQPCQRRLPFLAIDSPALRRLFEYLDPRSVKSLTANIYPTGRLYAGISTAMIIDGLIVIDD